MHCTLFLKCQDSDHNADLGNASDSDVDPLGGVHRGAGHSQRHRVQGHPATTNQIYSDTLSLLNCILLSATFLSVRFTNKGDLVKDGNPLIQPRIRFFFHIPGAFA